MASGMKNAQSTLLSGIASQFDNTATYPDVKISGRGSAWLCHRSVLSITSEWFRKAFAGEFKEALEGAIDLPDDSPDVVAAVLKYCYGIEYPIPETRDDSKIAFHVQVFAAAEKYFVQGLMEHATSRFELAAKEKDHSIKDLAEAAETAYTAVTDSHQLLKCKIIKHLRRHAATSFGRNSTMRGLLIKLPELGADMVEGFANAQTKEALQSEARRQTFCCPCALNGGLCNTFSAAIQDSEVYTKYCSVYDEYHVHTGKEWRRSYLMT